MQARAAADLKRIAAEELKAARLEFDDVRTFVTPRRLVLVVDGLPERQPDIKEERRGPRVGAPEKAVWGFLKSVGLETIDQCEVRRVDKGEFYFVTIERAGRATTDMLPALLADAITDLTWPKSMRWGAYQLRYVRPLHSILGIFDGKPLIGELPMGRGVLAFGCKTAGHSFLAPGELTISNHADYREKLREAFVLIDPAERRNVIWTEACRLAADKKLEVQEDAALLEEVAGLVEWPHVLMGSIDPDFMDLPPEVLTTAMRTHQKYFSLHDGRAELAPYFIVVGNMEPGDGGKAIVVGNERVLRARLADAKFFWDQDRKRTLGSRVPALEGMIFHAKLGTLDQKVERLEALAVELANHVPDSDKDRARTAARLCKADLTTDMVGEFPELQGVMGCYYAQNDGEASEVADAIADHYAPLGPSDRCPSAPISVVVGLTDKIDTLVGLFAIGERPTGSKDPFALRRAALGVIRLIIENDLRAPLRRIFETTQRLYAEQRFLAHPVGASTGEEPFVECRAQNDLPSEILGFFADRLKVHLRERSVRHDLISAIFAVGAEDDLVRLLARAEALREFLASEDGANLLTAYSRASNIVVIEEKRDSAVYDGLAEEALLRQPEERTLHQSLAETERLCGTALAAEDFAGAMSAVARLRRPVDDFFDKVTVNTDERELRENRLKLLSQIRATLSGIADFSKIEG